MNISSQEQGFTLIELMISVVLGLVLSLALVQTTVTTAKVSVTQQSVANAQEDQMLAFEYMSYFIRGAGLDESAVGEPRMSDSITGINGASDAPDTLTLLSRAGVASERTAALKDCMGNSYPVGSVNEMKAEFALDAGNLVCRNGLATPESVTLLSDVNDMQMWFGVDTAGLGSATQYEPISATPSGDVVSVRLCLLMAYNDTGGPAVPYTNCAGSTITPSDSKIYRSFTHTINLRN